MEKPAPKQADPIGEGVELDENVKASKLFFVYKYFSLAIDLQFSLNLVVPFLWLENSNRFASSGMVADKP